MCASTWCNNTFRTKVPESNRKWLSTQLFTPNDSTIGPLEATITFSTSDNIKDLHQMTSEPPKPVSNVHMLPMQCSLYVFHPASTSPRFRCSNSANLLPLSVNDNLLSFHVNGDLVFLSANANFHNSSSLICKKVLKGLPLILKLISKIYQSLNFVPTSRIIRLPKPISYITCPQT